MMLGSRLPILRPRACWALLALGTSVLLGVAPEVRLPESGRRRPATARALVRPLVARNALSMPTARDVVRALRGPRQGPPRWCSGTVAPDGTLRVGCVDTEDGAEALVRAARRGAMTARRLRASGWLAAGSSLRRPWPEPRSAS